MIEWDVRRRVQSCNVWECLNEAVKGVLGWYVWNPLFLHDSRADLISPHFFKFLFFFLTYSKFVCTLTYWKLSRWGGTGGACSAKLVIFPFWTYFYWGWSKMQDVLQTGYFGFFLQISFGFGLQHPTRRCQSNVEKCQWCCWCFRSHQELWDRRGRNAIPHLQWIYNDARL